jgi:hypothetical protein
MTRITAKITDPDLNAELDEENREKAQEAAEELAMAEALLQSQEKALMQMIELDELLETRQEKLA